MNELYESNEFNINFLLGLPRSGTSIVMAHLRGNQSIETGYGEPDHLYRIMASYSKEWFDGYEQHIKVCPEIMEKIIGESFGVYAKYFYSNLCKESYKKLAVLKHPWWAPLGHRLQKIFPSAKFVILFRHPYDVVASMLHFRNTVPAAKTMLSDDVEILAQLYVEHTNYLLKLLHDYTYRTYAVKFEDFLESPQETLQGIFKFLDCPISKEDTEKIIHDSSIGRLPATFNTSVREKKAALFAPEERYLNFSNKEIEKIKKWVGPNMSILKYEEK